jgi:hypothetical protein
MNYALHDNVILPRWCLKHDAQNSEGDAGGLFAMFGSRRDPRNGLKMIRLIVRYAGSSQELGVGIV